MKIIEYPLSVFKSYRVSCNPWVFIIQYKEANFKCGGFKTAKEAQKQGEKYLKLLLSMEGK